MKEEIERWELERKRMEDKVWQSIKSLKDGERICDMCLEPSNRVKVISFPFKGDVTICFLCGDTISKRLI